MLFILCLLAISTSFASTDTELIKKAQELFSPIERNQTFEKENKDLIILGKKLYFETKLSKNGTISCNSCHNLDTFGVDNKKTSPGHDQTRGGRNSPTTLNASMHIAQFWDGRAKDVEEQALGPLLNPIEHGLASKEEAMEKINDEEYISLFKKNGLPFKFESIGKAIGAFERTLITPSRFDKFLKGDSSAISAKEKKGLNAFINVGCTSCHSGPLLGGTSYQKLGLAMKYETADLGRYEVTKKSRDKFKFKVPSLRNIDKTFPYLHDGSIGSLRKAIKMMGKHQLGKNIPRSEVDDIESFLKSLTANN